MDAAVVGELPICAGCGRVLTGKGKVGVCGCWECYCEVCLADWKMRFCQRCIGEKAPTDYEEVRAYVSGMYEELWGVVAGKGTTEEKMQRLKGARERLKQAFVEAFATTRETSLPVAPAPSLPPQLPASQSSVHFPPLIQDFTQSQCEFCKVQLSPNPAGRCYSCGKVNLRTVQFNREQFLSSKWECPQCKLRNVHSNQKCIDCGSMKGGIGRRW